MYIRNMICLQEPLFYSCYCIYSLWPLGIWIQLPYKLCSEGILSKRPNSQPVQFQKAPGNRHILGDGSIQDQRSPGAPANRVHR